MSGPTRATTITAPDPGSFRDWNGRVFNKDGCILRALTDSGLADWSALAASHLFERFTASGELVATEIANEAVVRELQDVDPEGQWIAALTHERLPFVSYPYEWSFSMLKDAALLQLRLHTASLDENLTIKDATPYNVQWRGAAPVFVDVGSFERARAGEPWVAYRQFCTLFLFPLLLEAYRGVPFQPWLRGSVDGISPREFRSLVGLRDVLRKGVLRHVVLHASLERRYEDRGSEVRREIEAAGFDKRVVIANLDRMTRLVQSLHPTASESAWTDYRVTCSYGDRDTLAKDDFLRGVVQARHRKLVWDLGCNDGRHSLIAAETSEYVVAMDSDRLETDILYRRLRDDGNRSILPLAVDLADPSPAIGWLNSERTTLESRGSPDLVLCLALVHHLSIGRNIPLREIVAWLRRLDCEVVVEFPNRDDPMVGRLLATKHRDAHPDYGRAQFEALLAESFATMGSLELPSGVRVLYHVRPR